MTDQFVQLGISGVTLAILFFVVRWFTTVIQTKDASIAIITEKFYNATDKFTIAITNHMAHSTKVLEEVKMTNLELRQSVDNLSKVIQSITVQGKRRK